MNPVTIHPARHLSPRIGRSNAAGWASGPGVAGIVINGSLALPPFLSQAPAHSAEFCDIYGVQRALITDAFTNGSVTWELNGSGTASITGPATASELRNLIDFNGNVIDGVEIRLFRESEPYAWFVPLTPNITDRQDIRLTGPQFAYALARRYVGRIGQPPNLVTNGDFFEADGVTGWTSLLSMNWSADGPGVPPGGGSMVIEAPGPGNHFAYQTIDLPSQGFDTFLWVTAYLKIDVPLAQNKLPTQGRSIWAVFTVNGNIVWQQGVIPEWRQVGAWQRLRTQIFLPAGQTASMQLRLYAPAGQVRYGGIFIRREERLYAGPSMAGVMTALVLHAQQASLGKETANITVDGSDADGGNATRGYKYAERANIISAMNEFGNLDQGVTWTGEIVSGTGRSIKLLPRLGLQTGGTFLIEWGLNVSTWSWNWDGSKRADKVIVMSRGSGFDFAEGFYDDDTTTLGWELTRAARIESLEPQAEADGLGGVYQRPIGITCLVHRTSDLDPFSPWRDGDLRVGRLAQVKIYDGLVRINELMLIRRLTYNPYFETWNVTLERTVNLL